MTGKLTLNQLWQLASDAEKAYQSALMKETGNRRLFEIMFDPSRQSPHVRALGDIYKRCLADWTKRREENLREGKL